MTWYDDSGLCWMCGAPATLWYLVRQDGRPLTGHSRCASHAGNRLPTTAEAITREEAAVLEVMFL